MLYSSGVRDYFLSINSLISQFHIAAFFLLNAEQIILFLGDVM